MTKAKRSKQGFTLIEILVAIVIIGILASIAVPFFRQYLRNARSATFSNDIRTLANAGAQYALESGTWVNDSSTGQFPPELVGYFSKKKFELGSSLGGRWDFERDDLGGFRSAVGVHGPTATDEIFLIVDKQIDDGDLTSGRFQKLASDRYYYIIED